MKKDTLWYVLAVILVIVLVVSGLSVPFSLTRSGGPTETATLVSTATPILPSPTPNPCSAGLIENEANRVHALMREFDDTAVLAQTTQLNQTTVSLVQDLQRIRRATEDLQVPPCTAKLKQAAIDYMNAMINLFANALNFYFTYGPNADQRALDSITGPLIQEAAARLQLYGAEYNRIMGFTPLPSPTPFPPTETPQP